MAAASVTVCGVQYEDVADAEDAMKGINQADYRGRVLTVEYVAREANGRWLLFPSLCR